jgi:hypothetical protein
MRQNPERLAWTILLAAFVVFCFVAVGFPLLVRNYLHSARQPLRAQVNSQQGTVRIERGGGSRDEAIGLGDPVPLELFKGDSMRTGAFDEALLVVQRGDQENRETLISVVLYDDSDVLLVDAYSPRFGLSSGPHKAVLRMRDGRFRIEVQPSSDGRPVVVEVRTDHAQLQLNEGSYALEVTNQQTIATVRRGSALVRANDQELALSEEQRAVASLSGVLDGPLPAERNLIANGDFGQGIDSGWVVFSNAVDDSTSVTSASDEDQPVALFQHDQPQPSEIGLIQTLNRNVKDLESLVLHLKVRVDYHSLSVCGALGSECPVMVRIDYLDDAGNGRQWVHGFYAYEDPSIAWPYYCTTCPDPSSDNHNRVPEGSWFLYDSPDLMEIDPPELRPAVIQSVRVYASGHSYTSMVTDVELLAQD